MRVRFDPGEETLRIPFGTPRPLRFHDGELDMDLTVRIRGFAAVPRGDTEEDELRRLVRAQVVGALEALAADGTRTCSLCGEQWDALEEALEEALAREGRKAAIRLDAVRLDEASEKAVKEAFREKYARLGETLRAPADEPIMIDGPAAYPQTPGGFGLYRMGETPPILGARACPNCGHAEPPQANFCTRCGAKLT